MSHMGYKGIGPDEVLADSSNQKDGLRITWWLIWQDFILYSRSNRIILDLFDSIIHLRIRLEIEILRNVNAADL